MIKFQGGIVLLDIKGLLLHSYNRGKDPDAKLDAEDNLINSAGFGLRTFIESYLRPILADYAPLQIIAVWDGGNDYRTSLFADYKRKRREAVKNEAIAVQHAEMYNLCKALLAYIGAHNVVVKGVEADDLIAAFVQRMPDIQKIIHTVDQDLAYLNDDNTLVTFRDGIRPDFEGYPFCLVRAYKALVGDSSDGYNGVPQVGPVAFKHLVDTYGVDGVLELEQCVATNDYRNLEQAIAQTGDKVLIKINENRGVWRLMFNLASFHPWLCHRATAKEIVRPEWYVRMANADKVQEVLRRAKASFMFDLFEPFLPKFGLADRNIMLGTYEHFKQELRNTPFFSFDYEGYDSLGHDWKPALPDTAKGYVDVLSQELTGCSFSYGANLQYTAYIPVLHKDTANARKEDIIDVFLAAEEAGLDFVAHNARFEEQVSKQCLNFQLEGPICTQMLASYVDENEFQGLKDQSALKFRYEQMHYGDLLAKFDAKDMRDLTGEQVLDYACDDSLVAGRLFVLQWLVLHLEQQWEFAYTQDRYTCHPFNRSFETGVNVDYGRMQELADEDTLTITTNMAFIREQLAENCKQLNEAGALEMKKADGENLIKLKMVDGLNRSQAQAKLAEQYERWRQASAYIPYQETFTRPEFMPTAKGFTEVAKRVGITIELEKVTSAGLTEWLILARNEMDTWQDERARELFVLFSECGKAFAKRTGPEFEELKTFIETKIIHEDGKRVIEGDELNFNSPKQMQELFYCKLMLPVRMRTFPQKGSGRDKLGLEGNPGTNEEVVKAALAEDCPEGDWRREVLLKLLDVKEAMTRHSLYYTKYPHWKHPRDGVVHPSTRNNGTVTRRPAGGAPNLLAVSKGPLRSIFIPRYKGHVIVSLDFSGQELRLTGSESKDPVLIEAYTGLPNYIDEDGMSRAQFKDIHSITGCTFAAKVLEQDMGRGILDQLVFDQVGKLDYDLFLSLLERKDTVFERFEVVGDKLNKTIIKIRKMAKTVNFLIIYGGSAFTLAMKLGVPESFAQKIMDGVFNGYARLGPWQDEVVETAKKWGFITTPYGTRKHVPEDILARDRSLQSRAARQTVNHGIQGCAADILKVVLTGAYHTRLYEETKASMIAPVYDELTNSVPIDNVFEFVERAQDLMNITPPGHPIPMLAEVSIGRNWNEAAANELHDRPSQRKIEALFDSWMKGGWAA
jgi:DNA polymerase-1